MLFSRTLFYCWIILCLSGCATSPGFTVQQPLELKIETVNVQAYILVNYGPLAENIIMEKGQYLEGLIYLSEIPSQHQDGFLKDLNKVLLSEKDIYQFSVLANQIINNYRLDSQAPDIQNVSR